MQRYKVLKIIKENNDKRVSLVEQDDKKYIIKELISNDSVTLNMLKNEANQLRILGNTEISPKILNYEFSDANNFLVIELIKGKSVNKLNLQDDKKKLYLMIKIVEAVNIIHNYGVIHADLKPTNIIVDINSNVRIIDFDISIYNNKNYFNGYGSRHYCSINHLTNNKLTILDDLYSLGVIFYELMLNRKPFDGTIKKIKNLKINCIYDKCDNEKLNIIFDKIFNQGSINKYNSLNEFKIDLINLYKSN